MLLSLCATTIVVVFSLNLSNDFEITKVVTSEDDLILHSDRLQEIEKKIGKKAIWNS